MWHLQWARRCRCIFCSLDCWAHHFVKQTHTLNTFTQFCNESKYFKFQRYKLSKSTSTDSMQLFIWMPFCQFFELSANWEHLYELNTLAQVNTLKGCTKLQIVKLFSVDKTKHSCIREQLQYHWHSLNRGQTAKNMDTSWNQQHICSISQLLRAMRLLVISYRFTQISWANVLDSKANIYWNVSLQSGPHKSPLNGRVLLEHLACSANSDHWSCQATVLGNACHHQKNIMEHF